jgi:hypothetical protein
VGLDDEDEGEAGGKGGNGGRCVPRGRHRLEDVEIPRCTADRAENSWTLTRGVLKGSI